MSDSSIEAVAEGDPPHSHQAAVSQAVFAAHMNVTSGMVSKWERGEKRPSGPAAKLLTLAAKHGLEAIA